MATSVMTAGITAIILLLVGTISRIVTDDNGLFAISVAIMAILFNILIYQDRILCLLEKLPK